MIRRANESDQAIVEAMARKLSISYEINSDKFKWVWKALLEDQGAFLLVAEVDSKVCGYVLAFKHNVFYANGPVCYVEELFVDESKRELGMGRDLMKEIEARAAADGCAQVAVATRRAKDFYGAIGYLDSAAYFKKKI